MSTTNLLALLEARGVTVSLRGNDLAVTGVENVLADQELIASLRTHKKALIELIKDGHGTRLGAGLVAVPPNRIPDNASRITPDLLPLVSLSQQAIDMIVGTVAGGAANVQDIYPLAPLQEGMLFHHLLNSAGDVYTERHLLAFGTRSRLEGFLSALQQVMDRHDILRTGIVWEGLDQPVQVVRRQVELPVDFVELDAGQGDVAQQLEMRYGPKHCRIDVRQAPLLRCHAAHDAANGRWLLSVLVHHLAIDHMALELLVEEAQAIERGLLAQLPAPAPFRNFVAQARLGISQEEHAAFFKRMLSDVDEPTAPFGLLDVQGDGSGVVEAVQTFPLDLSQAIRRQARRVGVSAASLMHLAWALVLARTTGRQDVVFGTVLFGRMQGGAQADRILGLLMNTLPVRIRVDDQGVEKGLKDTHALLAQLVRHEHAPLALALRCSAVPTRAPLFTSLLNYRYSQKREQDPSQEGWAEEPGKGWESLGGHERTNYPLTLSVDDLGEDFVVTAQVSGQIAPRRVCDLLQTALVQLTRALKDAPQHSIRCIDVLPPADLRQVLYEWNETVEAYPRRLCVHQMFEAQVARTPEATAVVYEEKRLSYSELDMRANQLAHHLRTLGVGPDSRVAICAERSVEMVVAILATLKAGGCYVPLDPDYPLERLRYMLRDSAPMAVLVDAVGHQVLEHAHAGGVCPVPTLHLQSDAHQWAQAPTDQVALDGLSERHLAYVIYTSGSTGQPKGVMNEHRGVVNRLQWMQQAYGLNERDVVLQKTPFSFDVSVWEFFWPLMAGAQLVVARPEGHKDPGYLSELIRSTGVTTLHFVPSMLQVFLGQAQGEHCSTIVRVMCSGEALPAALACSFYERLPWAQLHNLYGPTEAAVDVTAWTCVAGDDRASIPIGRPIANTRMYILDERMQPVPVGVSGELYIGGIQVARGYLNQPELTAQRFIEDPFVAGERLYKTGDLGRWLEDGNIEYLGRNDFQVKIRGFRIELGEIEAQLARAEGVREVVVMARAQSDAPGEKRLVAYYTGESLTAEQLREHATGSLPQYMVPAAFVHLESMPLTPNGKLDRKALPAPQGDAFASRQYEAPQGELEQTLARLWCEVLRLERVGRHDNFFELGGHSLLAVQLVSRIRKAFGVEVALSELFTHPELAALAACLEAAAPATLSQIPLVSRDGRLQLSLAQQRLWFLSQMEEVSAAYHIRGAVRLSGALNTEVLQRALQRIVQRHEALRTCFELCDGEPLQRIKPQAELAVPEQDLREHPAPESEAQRLCEAHAQVGFDLQRELPVRVLLLRLAPEEYLLQVVMHHIASDGWSIGVLLEELNALYGAYLRGAEDPLPPLSIQYADYAAWQRGWLGAGELPQQSQFWRDNLSGAPTLLELPADRPRPVQQDLAGDSVPVQLDSRLSERLQELSQRHGVTLYMTMLASWAVLLARLSNQEEVVIGSPVAGRNRAEIEPLIGFFVNTLALRLDLQGEPTVAQMLERTKAQVLAAQRHQDLPFDQVVEAVKPPRSLAHTPVFQVMLDWHNTPESDLRMEGVRVSPVDSPLSTAQFDLTLSLTQAQAGISGVLNYATALFDRDTVQRYLGYWMCVLQALVSEDNPSITRVSLLPQSERQRVLYEWNETAREYPRELCVHQLFEAQVARTPNATAVVYEEQRLSYRELNARANQLAHHLRTLGVGPDSRVAICAERSVEMVVAILATMKAGGAYVPLDPSYASERLGITLADSQPAVVLLDATGRQALGPIEAGPSTVVDLEVDAVHWAEASQDNLDLQQVGLRPEHLAYVIYTSGSTGRPKGVMVEHAQVTRLFEATHAWFGFNAQDVWSLFHSFGFDFSVWELWGALLHGGRLVIVPMATARSPGEFYELLCEQGVTVLNQTPSAFQQLIAAQAHSTSEHCLRHIIFGGEALELHTLRPWYERNDERATQLVNMYGITETTVHVTYRALQAADAERAGPSPIGVRIPDLRLYVLDRQRQPVPVGVSGELYVGGEGVARGYLNQPELTAQRFIEDPFVAGGRLYKTGDLGRWLPDGSIEYLGRNDFQVKIRGFRIELGEIEAQLARLEGVREVVVLAREDALGEKRLVAYYTGESLAAEQLREHAAGSLPQYMVPAAFVHLESMPLTPNGKLDRRALPAPQGDAFASREYQPPQGEIESTLARLWCELLKLERVGRHDNFFELGGHSLLAVQLVSRIRKVLNVEVALSELFTHPELAALATRLEAAAPATLSQIPLLSRAGRLQLSLAQQRLWFLSQMEEVSAAFNIRGEVRLSGALNPEVLQRALQRIVQRHEALRTCFELCDGEPLQRVKPQAELVVQEHDLRRHPEPESEAQRLSEAHAQIGFDLRQEVPVRVLLLRLAPEEYLLQVVMHHIASDGWSVGVLLEELSTLYGAYLRGAADPLPPLSIQYADYAAWQRGWLAAGELAQQSQFWRDNLSGAPTLLELPTDRPRPVQQDQAGDNVPVQLDSRLSERLEELSQRHGVTLYMTMLASWAALLARLSNQEEVVIGSPVAGRNRAEIEPLIGFFVNTLALRLDLQGEPTLAQLLARTKAQVLAAQRHQDLPFDQVVEMVNPPRSPAHTPLFQVIFDWHNIPVSDLRMAGVQVSPVDEVLNRARFDLTLLLTQGPTGITGVLNYATSLFDRETVQRYLGYWMCLLQAMVAEDNPSITRVSLLPQTERHRVLYEWNETAREYPCELCVHQLFEAQVARAPEATAVIQGEQRLSFGELNARANQLAHYLRELGVGPDSRVALYLERSVEMVVAILATLKAGGAYVPMDPGYPVQRLRDMLEDAAPDVLLTQQRLKAALPENKPTVIALDEDWSHVAQYATTDLDADELGLTPRHLAYVIFTSGSTGRPKGVMIEHRSIVNYATHIIRQFDVAGGDGSLILTSFSFDLTLTSFYPPLLCGRAVRLCPEGNELSQWRRNLLDGHNLSPVKLTPSHLTLLSQGLRDDALDGRIRTLVLGGEALQGPILQWWRARAPAMRIFNHYGPTETTVGCVVNEVAELPLTSVPIGRPISNMRIYILDSSSRPVPIGLAGELYIGGVGVARGYINRPALTAERFMPDPFVGEPDAMMYRTGDVGRWRADGRIEYLGRNDQQVKIRGFRIELGEIEAALCTHQGVEGAAVIAQEAPCGEQRLVAYYMGSQAPQADALRQHAASCLPHYMVPAAFVRLQALPLTPNGKLDRKALPAPDDQASSSRAFEAPRGHAEQALARIWSELLKLERVGRHDNFFELGGHSLLVVSLIDRMRQAGLYTDVRTLFSAPTLATLAVQLRAESVEVAVPPNLIPHDTRHITPEMLTLVSLSQEAIDAIVAQVEGGASNVQDIYPLAPLQEGMLFHHLLNSDGDAYVESHLLAFRERSRLEGFLAALQQVIDRHDILRTGLAWEGLDQPVQVVRRRAQLPVEHIELDAAAGDIARQLEVRHDPRHCRLDVRRAPLLSCHIAHDGKNGRWVLSILSHHLAVDHTTMELLVEEAQAIETGHLERLSQPAPFRNYVAQARLGVSPQEHTAFFKQMLADIDAPTAPFGLLDVQGDGSGIAEARQALPPELSQAIRRQAHRLGVSAASLMHLAWALVLTRIAGRQDVVFGTVLFGRMQGGAEADRVLGLFMNTLPVRISIGGRSVEEDARQTHALLVQLLHHEHAPLALAQRCSAVPAQTPLFSSLLNYRYTTQERDAPESQILDEGVEFLSSQDRNNYPLTLSVDDLGQDFALTAQASKPIAPLRVCSFMQAALEQLLQALEQAPQRPTGELDVLPPKEREQLLVAWNDTAREYPRQMCIHQLFEAQVARTPEATALVHEEFEVCYRELNARANQLAHYLMARGVGTESLVALALERGVDMVVGLLGILKAGGAYVPLDPAYPRDRLEYILADARPALVLSQTSLQSVVPTTSVPVVMLDTQSFEIAAHPVTNPETEAQTPRHLAYVIYTSGSTGWPKGVMVEHRSVVNFMDSMWSAPGIAPEDVLLSVTSISFDIAALELFLPLLHGARVVIATRKEAADAERLRGLMERSRVSIMQATPSMWRMLTQQVWPQLPRPLKVLSGGEALPAKLAEQLLSRVSEVWNLYGPTETTIWSTARRLTDARPDIGRPIANTRMYILDERMQPVPAGVSGELYIGGAGVARGYLNQPELTAQRFIEDPFVAGERLYKTGDLGRWLEDGNIEYLGRNDFQVKIRGFRIELGEIEAQLARAEGVREVVVMARAQSDAPGEKRLVAYYTGESLSAEQLREHATGSLPQYMVPAAFVHLESMPLTPNGKLDRKALPAPQGDAFASRQYEAPQGELEQTLARLWCEVLRLERVGRHDNFFELGGHSLLAVQLVSRIRKALNVEVALSELFTHPELAALATRLEAAAPATLSQIPLLSRDGRLQLSLAQQRLWFLSQMEEVSAAYHIRGAVRLSGALNTEVLQRALQRIVQRHEALRTCFELCDGEPLQRIKPQAELAVPEQDLREHPAPESEAQRLCEAHAQVGFNLQQELPVRVLLLRLGEEEYLLQVVMHHIASDGWSIGVLLEELNALYGAYLRGAEDPLPPLSIQYADYAAWQRGWLGAGELPQQSQFWRDNLSGAPTLLELPADRPRPVQQDLAGDSVPVQLDSRLSERLQELSQRHGVTLYMTMLASWAVLLARLSNQEEVVIGSPVAGRNRAEIEPLIGFFVNTLALRLDLQGEPTVAQVLERTKAQVLAAQRHQDLPFDQVVEAVKPPRSLAHTPVFQVMLDWHNTPESDLRMEGVRVSPVDSPLSTAQFDLTLSLTQAQAGISGVLNYATALFDRDTVQRYLGYWMCVLQALVSEDNPSITRVSLLPQSERQRVLYEWNETAEAYPRELCVHQLFEAQVARTPNATAVVYEEQRLSYRELNARANQLAHHLRTLGVGPDSRVAICVERSVEMVVALVATLKAGGCYVPLDPDYPLERLRYMLQDSAPMAVLVDTVGRQVLEHADGRSLGAIPTLHLQSDADIWAQAPTDDITPAELGVNHLAYVIYTSGSTGQPKGVMNEHRGVVNRLQWMQQAYGLSERDVVLQKTPFSFDVSVWEFFWPLMAGAQLVVARPEGHKDPGYLSELIRSTGVTTLHFVPSMLQVFLEHAEAVRCNSIVRVVCSGEALPASFVHHFHERLPWAQLHNLYGPTEAAVDVTAWTCVAGDDRASIPIGRPIANTRMYILDEGMEPVPMGVCGELYIGGVQVARGYLNQPELTAQRFIEDPFVTGGRLYKTGDLGRWLADGSIEYLGRNDFQVKIRGFRIELGEIEAQLARVAGVREVVVVAREGAASAQHAVPGEKRLVAYYTGEAQTAEHLREHAAGSLPQYMVPAAFVYLERMPLTPNGKLDRKALPGPLDSAYVSRTYEAPLGEIEQTLAQLWSELLKLERVGRHDNFFELGGHSLQAIQLVSRIRIVLDMDVPLRELFAHPTLLDFAAAITRLSHDGLASNLTPFRRAGSARPVFFIHPGLGEIGYVNQLVSGIDPDIPVYGLSAIGFLPGEEPLKTLEEMATAYLRAIRRVQPHGPYRLVGWCVGGHIAHEMAHQLLGADEAIEFLGLIDAPTNARVDPSELASLLGRLPDEIPSELRARLNDLAAAGDRRGMLLACQVAGVLPADLPVDLLERYLRVQHTIKLAKQAYVPPRLPVTVTMFPASEKHADWSMDGWGELAEKTICIPVEGNHMSMVQPPHALSLGTRISEQVTQAAARSAADPAELHHPYRVTIQAGSTCATRKRALYCIPGAGANVSSFSSLSQALPSSFTVHGLQPRGLCGRLIPHSDIPAAARAYIKAVRESSPRGPYHLLGHSFGGWVAYEMALQLAAEGAEVPTLVLLDTAPPDDAMRGHGFHSRLDVMMELISLFEMSVEHPLGIVRSDLETKSRKEQLRILMSAVVTAGLLPAKAPINALEGIVRVFEVNANTRYQPGGRFPGVLHAVAIPDSKTDIEQGRELLRARWHEFALEPHISYATGNHMTMLREPHAHSIAAMVSAWLRGPAASP